MTNKIYLKLFVLFGILFSYLNYLSPTSFSQKTIVINEFMASNDNAFSDEIYGFHDWIELYNTTNEPINLKDYRIGKKKKFENNWVLPDTIIQPREHITIYCDKLNYTSDVIKINNSSLGAINYTKDDAFAFYYLESEGDFEAEIKVLSMSNFNFSTTIGLMCRKNLEPNSPYSAAFVGSPMRNRYIYSWRHEDSLYSNFFETNEIKYPFIYFKFKRKQDSLFLLKLEQGTDLEYTITTQLMPFNSSNYYLGLAVTSGDENTLSSAIITQLKINGKEININNLKMLNIDASSSTPTSSTVSNYRTLHSNFKLGKSGDNIYLFDNLGNQIDFVEYKEQISDVSFGREFDGIDNFVFLNEPTPEMPNTGKLQPRANAPKFDIESGFYDNKLFVNIIENNENCEIYYTTDAGIPSKNSNRFTNSPIEIFKTTVLRAIAYATGDTLPSRIITSTYFINETNFNLPLVSITADSTLLWDDRNGIMADNNIYYNWIIPANFEFFNNKTSSSNNNKYNSACGLRLNGNTTRNYPQKSFRLYAQDKYQSSSFNYYFFDNKNSNNYEKIILRNGGNDWYGALLRDQLGHTLCKYLNNLEHTPVENVLTFVNGKFYGIHQLMERHDKTYLSNKYDIETTSITMVSADNPIFDQIKYGSPYEGISTWYKLYDTLKTLDMSNDSTGGLDYLTRNIDIDNFFDYLIYNIYACNLDWPHNNMLAWKSKELDNRWRWMLHDMDVTFNESELDNTLSEKTITGSILNTLLKNSSMRNKFINRFADLMNSILSEENVLAKIDSISITLEAEISRQNNLYAESCSNWAEEILKIKKFAVERPTHQKQHLITNYNLSGLCTLNISSNFFNDSSSSANLSKANIKINTLTPELKKNIITNTNNWSGVYFQGVPVKLSVEITDTTSNNFTLANKFVAWYVNNNLYSTDSSIILDLAEENLDIQVVFQDDNSMDCRYNNNLINNKNIISGVKVYPTPVSRIATIKLDATESKLVEISIKNMDGKTITEFSHLCKIGSNVFEYDFSKLLIETGTYFIYISDKNNTFSSSKFIYIK